MSIRYRQTFYALSLARSDATCVATLIIYKFGQTNNRIETNQSALSFSHIIMKTSFSILFVTIAGLTTSVAGTNFVGLRVLHNHGVPIEGATCTDAESNVIQAIMYATITESTRKLRGDRRVSVDCDRACIGFPAGQCHLAYPWCPNRRLLLDDEAQVKSEAEQVDPIAGRLLTDDAELVAQCQSQADAVIEVLHGGLGELVSDPCNSLLEEHIDLACFIL